MKRKPVNARVFLVVGMVAALGLFVYLSGRGEVVGEGSVGVTTGRSGSFRVTDPGTRPFHVPFLEEYHVISSRPVVVSFVDEESVPVPSGKSGTGYVESQLTYAITDFDAAIGHFGARDLHASIREAIRQRVHALVKEAVTDAGMLDESRQRLLIIAEIHVALNEGFQGKGVSISGFQMRYR